jgi:hypothetical protein
METPIGDIPKNCEDMAPITARRKSGKFWTNTIAAEKVGRLLQQMVKPTYIFEPFVGGGSLIQGFSNLCRGAATDIDEDIIKKLSQEFRGLNWSFYVKNLFKTSVQELSTLISLEPDDVFLIYTNPPYGTISTNALVSKAGELRGSDSRSIEIAYGCDPNEQRYIKSTYGAGDLFLPSMGKLIELIKQKSTGFLAFFCPSGVFFGRSRYRKLCKELLKNFEFIYGEIFSGKYFEDVSKQKAIAFTIWKFCKDANTEHTSLKFNFEGREYQLKRVPLLKEGWKYDEREDENGEIMVQHCETFNSAPPKMFHIQPSKGGSALVPKNVKRSLSIPDLYDPLIYGLWSITVGYRAIVTPPVVFDNCYVHLPDFTDPKVQEILALSALFALIAEMLNNYCKGKMGFIDRLKTLKFGGPELTESVVTLFKKYSSVKVIEKNTIADVLERLKIESNPDKIDKNLRKEIRERIRERLDQIGYWKFLPIP